MSKENVNENDALFGFYMWCVEQMELCSSVQEGKERIMNGMRSLPNGERLVDIIF